MRHSFLTKAATVLLAVGSAAIAFGASAAMKQTQPAAAETPKDVSRS